MPQVMDCQGMFGGFFGATTSKKRDTRAAMGKHHARVARVTGGTSWNADRADRPAGSRRDGAFHRWSRPISRVLSWAAIPLGPASPQGSSNQPGSDAGNVMTPLFGLAPGGVCRATRRWPRARCALTAPFHPCHACLAAPFGGLFSVALSVGSRRPGVTWHPALWSPDFPRRVKRDAAAWPAPRPVYYV